jgi:serine/threonine protein phosphatase PrpC
MAMQIEYAFLSVPGPVREVNEDSTAFSLPTALDESRARGAAIILADGVGGHDAGEIASKLACDAAMERFQHAEPGTTPNGLIFQMIAAANKAVYDRRMAQNSNMASTLSITVFRNDEVTVGHVGDCRVYLIAGGRIRRVTNDHSYSGVQLKLGLITVDEARLSELRSVLTRCIGKDPVVRVDYHNLRVNRGDVVVQCCDGLHCFVSEQEIFAAVTKHPPQQACQMLVDLAIAHGGDDNLSIQIARVTDVERMSYYRGLPIYQKVPDLSMGTEVQTGQILDDRFVITDVIARSGMGTIFKATDIKADRTVALKVPFMHLESDPQFFSRFQREEEIGKRLHHPYILNIDDSVEKKSRPYIVMEYLEGQTLGHLMQSMRPIPVPDALRIASRICEALYYMHEHDVVHRDLKPDNVMICNDGSIRIMDFGIAKVEGARRLTFGSFQPAMGTPDYMAPEQVRGRRGDARTDIYSLGAILYEMVTGAVPFEGATPLLIMNARLTGDPIAPRRRLETTSPQVEEIILRAMQREPANRYPTALAMKADLDKPDSVSVTGLANRLQSPAPWKSRLRTWRIILLAVGVPLAVALFLFLRRHIHLNWQ